MTVFTQVLAALFVVLVATAGVAAFTIARRQRLQRGTSGDRAQLASQLIELEEELNYAEAFSANNPTAVANLAQAHSELNAAFATYNRTSAVEGQGIPTADANNIYSRLALVKDILANPDVARTGLVATNAPSIIVNTQLSPTITNGSRLFEVAMWVLGIVPGAVLTYRKSKARNYFVALDRRINANAAQIDVYLERRAAILRACPEFIADIDPTLASGLPNEARNITTGRIDHAYQVMIERAKARSTGPLPPALEQALRDDRSVQREITAARTLYNDTVNMWNTDIFQWPAKQMVAADERLTTKPIFVGSQLDSTLDLNRVR